MYGYSSQAAYSVEPSTGVAADLARELLRITATAHRSGGVPLTAEFPLVLVRACATCGDHVSVYAKGSPRELCRQAGADLFAAPWEVGAWTLLEARGGFALVAAHGHRYRRNAQGHPVAECRDSRTVVVFAAELPAAAPPPPVKPRAQASVRAPRRAPPDSAALDAAAVAAAGPTVAPPPRSTKPPPSIEGQFCFAWAAPSPPARRS